MDWIVEAALWGVAGFVLTTAGLVVLIWRLSRPVVAPMDPAIAEDREVRMLDEWWALPTREPLS